MYIIDIFFLSGLNNSKLWQPPGGWGWIGAIGCGSWGNLKLRLCGDLATTVEIQALSVWDGNKMIESCCGQGRWREKGVGGFYRHCLELSLQFFCNCKLLLDQNGVSIHNFHLFWENALLSFQSVYRIAISWAASKPGYNLNGEILKSDEGRICNKRYSSNTHQEKSSFPRTLWRHTIALGISCSKTAQ